MLIVLILSFVHMIDRMLFLYDTFMGYGLFYVCGYRCRLKSLSFICVICNGVEILVF